jgi:hypothetical protein
MQTINVLTPSVHAVLKPMLRRPYTFLFNVHSDPPVTFVSIPERREHCHLQRSVSSWELLYEQGSEGGTQQAARAAH